RRVATRDRHLDLEYFETSTRGHQRFDLPPEEVLDEDPNPYSRQKVIDWYSSIVPPFFKFLDLLSILKMGLKKPLSTPEKSAKMSVFRSPFICGLYFFEQ